MRCCPFEENWCAVKKIPIFIGFGTSSTFYKGHLEVWKSMKVLHWLLLTSKEDSPGCCNLLHTCSAKCKLKSGHQIFQHTRIYQVRLYALETPEKRKFFTRERYTATQRLKIQCGKWFAKVWKKSWVKRVFNKLKAGHITPEAGLCPIKSTIAENGMEMTSRP